MNETTFWFRENYIIHLFPYLMYFNRPDNWKMFVTVDLFNGTK